MKKGTIKYHIDGSVYDVRCPCGHVEPLCLAQDATAIVCLACKEELALPTLAWLDSKQDNQEQEND